MCASPKVLITKGSHINTIAYIIATQSEETGVDKTYSLVDGNGCKIWNGSYTWFPSSFITVL